MTKFVSYSLFSVTDHKSSNAGRDGGQFVVRGKAFVHVLGAGEAIAVHSLFLKPDGWCAARSEK